MDANLIIAVLAILALVAVGAFLIYRRQVHVDINTPVGSMKLNATNRPVAGFKVAENADLTGAEIEDMVSGNRIQGQKGATPSGKTGGIEIGKGAKLKDTKMKNVTGGDEIKE